MRYQSVKHSCGHWAKRPDNGWNWEARLCPKCYKTEMEKKRVSESAEAVAANAAAGYPALTGTPKQIAWAETIRFKMFKKLPALKASVEKDAPNKEQRLLGGMAISVLENTTDAVWFIDNRDRTARQIIIDYIQTNRAGQ